jgi:L-rhamnose mutarotase
MKIKSYCISLKKFLPFSILFFLLFLNCNKKEIKTAVSISKTQADSTYSEDQTDGDYTSDEERQERKKYMAFLKDFLSRKESQQSIDTLNARVEKAMDIYANGYVYKDEDFTSINDELTKYVESKNSLKIAESFYTSGLLESYGYFSFADGHPIIEFKKGAKLGSTNCIKYLAIIYFERILHKHKANLLCDPVCMTHRGRNYIEETHLASLSKSDMLNLTSSSDNLLLKTIYDQLQFKMSDAEILNYVIHLRTHNNPLFNINNTQVFDALNSLKTLSKSEDEIAGIDVFTKLIDHNPTIEISDIAELFTFNYPAYQNDSQFLFWVKLDLQKRGIETYDQCVENYNLDQLYGIVDFGSPAIYKGLLKYFAEKGDQKSENLLKEYAKS